MTTTRLPTMPRTHSYEVSLRWTGNRGSGTSNYRAFHRDHEVTAPGKSPIDGSSDASFRGDAGRWNPEELLVVSLAQCHMLWYLHLAAVSGVVVTAYEDRPLGEMTENSDGSGQFGQVRLRPTVTIADPSMRERAQLLHAEAHAKCFIARSVNFPVAHEPQIRLASADRG